MNRANSTFLWIALTALLVVCGCAPSDKGSSLWLGKSEGDLLAAFGKPDGTATLSDGRKVHTWERYESAMQAVPCRDSYTIGLDGNVEEFAASGCGGKAALPPARRMRRGF